MSLLETTFRVADLETTGVDGDRDKIVEIAWLDCELNQDEHGDLSLGVLNAQEFLVNPGEPIPYDAMAIHHITDTMVSDAPTIEQVVEDHWSYPPTPIDILVSHNKDFEISFMKHHIPEAADHANWLCTWRLSKHVVPEAKSFSNQALRYYFQVYDLPPEARDVTPHRALADCWFTAYNLLNLIDRALKQDFFTIDTPVSEVIKLVGNPTIMLRCPLGDHRGKEWKEVPTDFLLWMYKKRNTATWDDDVKYTVIHEMIKRGIIRHSNSK